jgi:hypothetical protein
MADAAIAADGQPGAAPNLPSDDRGASQSVVIPEHFACACGSLGAVPGEL